MNVGVRSSATVHLTSSVSVSPSKSVTVTITVPMPGGGGGAGKAAQTRHGDPDGQPGGGVAKGRVASGGGRAGEGGDGAVRLPALRRYGCGPEGRLAVGLHVPCKGHGVGVAIGVGDGHDGGAGTVGGGRARHPSGRGHAHRVGQSADAVGQPRNASGCARHGKGRDRLVLQPFLVRWRDRGGDYLVDQPVERYRVGVAVIYRNPTSSNTEQRELLYDEFSDYTWEQQAALLQDRYRACKQNKFEYNSDNKTKDHEDFVRNGRIDTTAHDAYLKKIYDGIDGISGIPVDSGSCRWETVRANAPTIH